VELVHQLALMAQKKMMTFLWAQLALNLILAVKGN